MKPVLLTLGLAAVMPSIFVIAWALWTGLLYTQYDRGFRAGVESERERRRKEMTP